MEIVSSHVAHGQMPAVYKRSFCFPVTGTASTLCSRLSSLEWRFALIILGTWILYPKKLDCLVTDEGNLLVMEGKVMIERFP